MATTAVDPTLLDALADTRVDVAALTARVGEHSVSAETQRQLRAMLATAMYLGLHVGAPAAEPDALRPRHLRDARLEARLRAGIPHRSAPVRTSVVTAPLAIPPAGPQSVLIRLSGVRVRVPVAAVADGPDTNEVTVNLPAAWAALSPGFLVVDGPHGREHPADSQVRRIFLHITGADGAPAVWGAVLSALNATGAPYRAKVLSDPTAYPRRDALVVYHGDDRPDVADAVRSAVAGAAGLGPSCSAFARRLAPGVAVAAEPVDVRTGMHGLSFGQHRCMATAAALVRHAIDGGRLDDHLATALCEANIDPADPANNLTTAAGQAVAEPRRN